MPISIFGEGSGGGGGSGDVTGAPSSTDNAVARFDGTTGKSIQNSSVLIDDSDNVTGVVDLTATGTVAIGGVADVEELIKSNGSTGLLTGGEVTVNGGDNTKVDIAAGTGLVVDWTTPASPVVTQVSWSAFTAESLPDIGTTVFTSLSISSAGALVKTGGAIATPAQRRSHIQLQGVIHTDLATVTSIGASSTPAYEVDACLLDYVLALGVINTGNNYQANGANLQVDKTAGTSVLPFINRDNDTQNPTTANSSAAVAVWSICI